LDNGVLISNIVLFISDVLLFSHCPGNILQPSHVPSAVEVKPSGRTELPEVIVTS
jgi:hypothetical protein